MPQLGFKRRNSQIFKTVSKPAPNERHNPHVVAYIIPIYSVVGAIRHDQNTFFRILILYIYYTVGLGYPNTWPSIGLNANWKGGRFCLFFRNFWPFLMIYLSSAAFGRFLIKKDQKSDEKKISLSTCIQPKTVIRGPSLYTTYYYVQCRKCYATILFFILFLLCTTTLYYVCLGLPIVPMICKNEARVLDPAV